MFEARTFAEWHSRHSASTNPGRNGAITLQIFGRVFVSEWRFAPRPCLHQIRTVFTVERLYPGGENAPSIVSTVHAALYAEPSRTYLINPLTTRIEASRKDLRSRADNVRHALTLHAVRKVLSRACECEAISSSSNFPLRFSDILSKASFTTASPCPRQLPHFLSRETCCQGKFCC